MDKAALRQAIIGRLEAELRLLLAAANDAKAEATDEDSRQEGKYDMRGQTAAYLAAGQARLAAELEQAIAGYRTLAVDPLPAGSAIELGAVAVLEAGGRQNCYFVGPSRGGLEIEVGGLEVTVITAASPVGSRLIGRRAGEKILLAGQRDSWAIASVE